MIKSQFPIFTHHPELVYLDNAASVQKPAAVIDAVKFYLENEYANIHRGQYPLALISEQRRREARQAVAALLDCKDEEVVFTANSTASVNLLSTSFLRSKRLKKGDLIVLSKLEHHANIVPWQLLAEQTDAEVVYLGRDAARQYDVRQFTALPQKRIKIISLSLVSNVTGQILDTGFVKKLSNSEALFILDASQAAPHMLLDIGKLGADFLYFTGHKLGALTGIGVLYGQAALLQELLPGMSGGGAIEEVTMDGHTYQPAPDKFEPGTPNVVGAVSLHEALKRIGSLATTTHASLRDQFAAGYEVLAHREQELMSVCKEKILSLHTDYGIQLVGSLDGARIGVFSFLLPDSMPGVQTVALHLAEKNICVRVGTHCTHPLHRQLISDQSIRMSLRVYNDISDIERFFSGMEEFLQHASRQTW